MADYASLVLGIPGLVAVALQVAASSYNHFSEAVSAREDIQKLVSEASLLAEMLEPLSTLSQASQISETSHSDSIRQLVQQCTQLRENLQGDLQQLSGSKTERFLNSVGSSEGSLRWPFKKEGIQERIEEIERLKKAVSLVLQMCVAYILFQIALC